MKNAMSLRKFVLVLLYFSTILGVTLFISFSVDIYVSVQFIGGSLSSSSVIGLYAISLLSMYLGVSLFTFFDRAYSSKVVGKNIFHSMLYAVGIILILSFSECMQLSFVNNTLAISALPLEANLSMMWQIMVARTIFFALGSPFIAYFTCIVPTRHAKIVLAHAT